jgi:hypothetical protein
MVEVELASIRDDRLLSELLNTDEPTDEAKALLDKMRRTLAGRRFGKLRRGATLSGRPLPCKAFGRS